MDLEAYVVDIRVTWILTVVGIIAHTFWTPADNMHMQWLRPGPEGAALAISASVGLLIGYILFLRRPPVFEPELEPDTLAVPEPTEPIPAPIVTPRHGLRWLCLLICIALLAGYLSVMLTAAPQRQFRGIPRLMTLASDEEIPASRYDFGMIRLAAGLAMAFFGLAAVAAQPHAEADVEIIEAIKSEAPDARAQAFWELKMLSPAVILAILTMFLLIWYPESRTWVAKALAWNAVGDWQPLLGLSTGLLGWIMGGVVGWLARIIFTLFFGKEALGMGDVHILAAAGAIAGWPVAFLGFFLAAPLTLLAIAVIHLRRQSRALPYGPWLAMAFLIAAVFQDRILIYMGMRG
jgi:prepilin signal peptidase PulO-like enzyme (type II secretory pathway)